MAVLDVFNWEGVAVAPSATKFTVAPTWTRLDTLSSECRVAAVEIRRGRSDEFERTDTGTCTVTLRDRDGTTDPTTHNWISRPLAFAVRNPVTDTWHPRFRGHIEDHGYNMHPSRFVGEVVIEAADALSYFAGLELVPSDVGDAVPLMGDIIPNTPAGRDIAGSIFYEDFEPPDPTVQTRILQALEDAGWPNGLTSIFTGNVALLEAVYAAGESVLSVIHDAADAEWPGVANFYIDRYGVVCFHGRNARFNPSGTASDASHWDFHVWDLGEGGTQIGPPWFVRRSASMIRNSAICYPAALERHPGTDPGIYVVFPAKLQKDQHVQDASSIATHGLHSWSATDLHVRRRIVPGGTDIPGPEECKNYAQYIVDNYSQPQLRLSQVTIRPVRPTDPRAADIWDLLCNVDISDKVNIDMNHPGLGGVTESFFVEGITERWEPLELDLDTGYPMVEMTLDLSPAAYWTTPP